MPPLEVSHTQPMYSSPLALCHKHLATVLVPFRSRLHFLPIGESPIAISNGRINYANYGNPNGPTATTAGVTPLPIALPEWPVYGTDERSMLRFKAGNLTIFKDDYRQEQIAYINSVGQDLSHRDL